MTPEKREVLESMKNNQFGDALRTHLAELMEELGDVESCSSWEDTMGRKHAKKFLREAFSFLGKIDKKVPKRNQYS